MTIPPRFLDEIRARLTLSDIIGRQVKVTRAGREFKACCPFHHEKSPSFTINDDKQFYHCFGCGAHGDVVGFVMRHNNLSFVDAVETLAAEAGLQMPRPDPKAVEQAQKQKGLHALMDDTAGWFSQQLNDSAYQKIAAYVEGRGLGLEACEKFRIGYAPDDGQALRKYLKAQGYSDAQMIEAGVVKASAKGGEPYAFFRDRVMFPVADKRGRVVAFGGRVLPEHLRAPQRGDFVPPKYINSSDTPLFDKGRTLYAESFAAKAARDGHTLIVTEGYMDVIAAQMAGFKGAVAPMGTALTEAQIISLWRMMGDSDKTPILCFDGDNAGRRAASRACERILPLLQPGKSFRFAFLPEGEDPDSLLKSSGRQGLQNILAGALSLFDFLWVSQTAGRSFETPEERAGLQKSLGDTVARIEDMQIQKYYNELIRTRISESFFTPKRYESKAKPGSRKSAVNALKLRRPNQAAGVISEKILLAAMINHPQLFTEVEEDFGRTVLSHPRYESMRGKIIQLFHEDAAIDSEAMQHRLKADGYAQEMGDILSESVYVHATFCRPLQRGVVFDIASALDEWGSVVQQMRKGQEGQEIKQGWKNAFVNANEDEENRLKDRVRLKASEEC